MKHILLAFVAVLLMSCNGHNRSSSGGSDTAVVESVTLDTVSLHSNIFDDVN